MVRGGSPQRPPTALTVAGTDSGGGAGVVADVRTFTALGVWPLVAITAVTAQNSLGVQAAEMVTPEMVRAQIASVVADMGADAAKTGMLGSADVVDAVAVTVAELGIRPLVVDPVVVAGSGDRLLDDDGLEAMRELLVPLAAVVTPNLDEASALVGGPVDDRRSMEAAARALVELGAAAALVTGGHLDDPISSADCLVVAGEGVSWLEGARLPAGYDHGGGCVLSAAICAGLARGLPLGQACNAAKRFTARAIGSGVRVGDGTGAADPVAAALEPGAGRPAESGPGAT